MSASEHRPEPQSRSSSDGAVVTWSILLVAGLFLGSWVLLNGAPGLYASSWGIIAVLAVVGLHFGYVSLPMVVIAFCYVPALSFFWARLNGATYVNLMNPWLQEDAYFVNMAVFLSLVSLMSALAGLLFFRRALDPRRLSLSRPSGRLSQPLFLFSSLLAGFFFWLTDPGKTILTATYTEVLEGRFKGTEFAGGLGLLCWLLSYATLLSLDADGGKASGRRYRFARGVFWSVTVLSLLWLFLHSRRSELLGMLILFMLVMAEKKGTRRAAVFMAVTLAGLVINGLVRSRSLAALLSSGDGASSLLHNRPNVSSLPGGASQVFMSFVDVVHYFKDRPLYYGETFFNYAFQILPSAIYRMVGIEKPPYFFETGVFDNYSWNGGTNGMSIFYGNFGVLGCVLYGLFVAAYIAVCAACLKKKDLAIKVIGLYLVAIAVRGFWYEFIIIIKPALFLLAFSLLTSGIRARRRQGRSAGATVGDASA